MPEELEELAVLVDPLEVPDELVVLVVVLLVADTVPTAEVVVDALVTTVPVDFNFSADSVLIISTLSTVAELMNSSLSSANT